MKYKFICKIPTLEEMNIKWDYEIEQHKEDKSNWIIWKAKAIENFMKGNTIPYYGVLNGKIICEASALINAEIVQNSNGLVGKNTAYLSAFRTIPEYQGNGYFGILFKFVLNDLKEKGYTKVTLGVEPNEEKNKKIYKHYGFTEYIKSATEQYPDGTIIDVEYYGRNI